MQINRNYYAELGVSQTATDKEIRRSYRALARRYHPDLNQDTGALKKFQIIQEAHEILSDPVQRKKYDQWYIQQGFERPTVFSLQTITSHQTLLTLPEEQAYYMLLDITPATDLPAIHLPLNLCLVVDRSTSMQGARLRYVKDAIYGIIDKLQPEDTLSLVVFSDRPEVLLSSQDNIDKDMARSIVSKITPGGGTEISPALSMGLKEIERSRGETSVNHLILLTDGQTYGDEKACLEQAKQAGLNQISLSTIGIGTDWNEDFLDQMAAFSNGASTYVDSPSKIKNIFEDTIRNLQMIFTRKLTMTLNLGAGIHLQEAFQITPHIRRLDIQGGSIELGTLGSEQSKSLLLEFRVQGLEPGERDLMRIKVEGDLPSQTKYRNWASVDLKANVEKTAKVRDNIPQAIAMTLGKLAIFKMQEKVMTDLEANKVKMATRRLEVMATRLLDLGETSLAQVALLEAGQLAKAGVLSATGHKAIRYGTRVLQFNN